MTILNFNEHVVHDDVIKKSRDSDYSFGVFLNILYSTTFMQILWQVGINWFRIHGGGTFRPPDYLMSKKPSLFKVKGEFLPIGGHN